MVSVFENSQTNSSGILSCLGSAVPVGSDLGACVIRGVYAEGSGRTMICAPRQIGTQLKTMPTPHGLAMLSGLLSAFLTFGLNPAIDEICRKHLGVVTPTSDVITGLHR